MAISPLVYSQQQFRVAFAEQATWGTPIATGATYYEIPVTDLTMPDYSGILTDEAKRSDGTLIANTLDSFRSNEGSEYTFQVSGILTRKIAGFLFYGVSQGPSAEVGSPPNLKTYTFDGTPTSDFTPAAFWSILVYDPAGARSQQLCDCVLRTLTVTCDPSSNGGRATFTATFVTGHIPAINATATPSGWTGAASTDVYYTCQTMSYKTIATVDVVLGKYEITIDNGAVRGGFDGSGNAEGFHLGMQSVTGSIEVKYDANTKDLLDKWLLSPDAGSADFDIALNHNSSGNNQFTYALHCILAAQPSLAGAERGVYQTINFKCVNEGSTDACVITHADGIDQGWIGE